MRTANPYIFAGFAVLTSLGIRENWHLIWHHEDLFTIFPAAILGPLLQ